MIKKLWCLIWGHKRFDWITIDIKQGKGWFESGVITYEKVNYKKCPRCGERL